MGLLTNSVWTDWWVHKFVSIFSFDSILEKVLIMNYQTVEWFVKVQNKTYF